MALNWRRLIEYAKTKIDGGVASGNKELDRLEAELAERQGDRPPMSDGVAPSIDEVRARIEWQLDRSGPAAPAEGPASATPVADAAGASTDSGSSESPVVPPDAGGPGGTTTGGGEGTTPEIESEAGTDDGGDPSGPGTPGPRSPEQLAVDAEAEQASIEWEARREATADRLADIRRELGIE